MKRKVLILSATPTDWYYRHTGLVIEVTEDLRYPDLWLACPVAGVLSLSMQYIKRSDCMKLKRTNSTPLPLTGDNGA
jgi:hypothetical protein